MFMVGAKVSNGARNSNFTRVVLWSLRNSGFEVQGWGEVGLGSSLWIPLGPMCDPPKKDVSSIVARSIDTAMGSVMELDTENIPMPMIPSRKE